MRSGGERRDFDPKMRAKATRGSFKQLGPPRVHRTHLQRVHARTARFSERRPRNFPLNVKLHICADHGRDRTVSRAGDATSRHERLDSAPRAAWRVDAR